MPSTIVKLCSSDARAWAHNQPVWIEENGEVARPVTRSEQQAISRALERTSQVQESFRQKLPLLPPGRSGPVRAQNVRDKAQVPMLDCAFHVQHIGKKRVVNVYTGTLRYTTGRELLKARLLADHGECLLHGRNGKMLGVLRDPFIHDREPKPPGPRVQFSRDPNASVPPVKTLAKAPPARSSGVLLPVKSPAQCPNDCRGKRGGTEWSLSDKAIPPSENEHHPMCNFAKSWAKTLAPHETGWVIYDFDRAEVAREASALEVAEAEKRSKEIGVAQVTIAERVYGVLTQADAEQAMLEARGIDPASELSSDEALAALGDELSSGFEDSDDDRPEDEAKYEPYLDDDAPVDDGIDAEAAAMGAGFDEIVVESAPPEPVPLASLRTSPPDQSKPPSRAVIYQANRRGATPSNPRAIRPPSAPVARVNRSELSTLSDRESWPDASEIAPKREKEKARVTIQTYLTRHDPPEGAGA